MKQQVAPSEYLVISRGQWDKDVSRQEIQNAIEQFYVWLSRLVDEGKMKPGQRLATEGKTVFRKTVVTDGPFGETKGSNRRLLVHPSRQPRGSCGDCRRQSLSEVRLVLRDSAHRPGAGHRFHSDERDTGRAQRPTTTARDVDESQSAVKLLPIPFSLSEDEVAWQVPMSSI